MLVNTPYKSAHSSLLGTWNPSGAGHCISECTVHIAIHSPAVYVVSVAEISLFWSIVIFSPAVYVGADIVIFQVHNKLSLLTVLMLVQLTNVSCLLFKSVLVASTEVSALIVILPLPHHKLIQVQATAFAQVFLSVTVQVHQLADVNL